MATLGNILGTSTLYDLLSENMDKYSDRIALRSKEDGEWVSYTYGELKDVSTELALGFIEIGIGKDGEFGDRVVILTENRPEFVITDLALKQIGAITSPAHKEYTASEIKYNLLDSGAKSIVVSTDKHLSKVLSLSPEDVPLLEHIIITDPHTLSPATRNAVAKDKRVISLDGLLNLVKSDAVRAELKRRRENISPDDVVTLIYTSGTTSDPKGVMLTSENLLAGLGMIEDIVDLPDPYVAVNILPLPHAFGYLADYLLPFLRGGEVIYSAKEDLKANMAKWKPTIMAGAPRLFQKFRKKILAKYSFVPSLMETAEGEGIKATVARKVLEFIGTKLTGGRLRFFVSGGSALPPELNDWMEAIGIQICQGYGMTEAVPISFNTDGNRNRTGTGSAGKILRGLEVIIEPDYEEGAERRYAESGEVLGEVQVAGPIVMKGYWGKPDLTREVLIEREGKTFMRTGDLGYIRELSVYGERQPHVFLLGRIKEEEVLSTGKNVSPTETEDQIIKHDEIEQAMVHAAQRRYIGGELKDRPYITALIGVSRDSLTNAAEQVGAQFRDVRELYEHPDVVEYFRGIVSDQVSEFAIYKKPKDIILIPEITEETSWKLKELEGKVVSPMTPSAKLKRTIVQTYYRERLDALYPEE